MSSTYRMPASEGSEDESAAPVRESKSPASVQSIPAIARLAESYEELRADVQLLKRQVLRISEQLDDEGQQPEDGAASESAGTGGRWRRSRVAVVAAAILIAAGVAAGGPRLWSYFNSYESTDDAQIDAHIAPVSARISGTVIDVYVEDNQKVSAGALLAQIDPRDFQVALDRARAALAQAQAEVKVIAQQELSAAAQVQGYQATAERTDRDWKRFGVLYKGKIIAPQSYDRLVQDARVAASSVAAARAMDSATENSMASVRAAVDAAKAGVAEAELNLSYTRIVAPVSGIIGKRSLEVGQRVVPGQQMLALVETSNLWITADYMETQTGPMHPGLPVRIYVDALRENFEGVLESIAGASGDRYSLLPPENATGNYVKVVQRIPVRIGLRRGQQDLGELRPGMSVEATVWLQ